VPSSIFQYRPGNAAGFIAKSGEISNHSPELCLGVFTHLSKLDDFPGRLLHFYKRWISPLLGQRCRFYPSCSVYCADCVRRHGWIVGGWMGVARLVRCQPFAQAGFDPVPEQFFWLGSRVQEVHGEQHAKPKDFADDD
jgi:uncharacterized protein